MPEKIIGLDIGSYSIKMTTLKGKFRGFEVLDFLEKKIDSPLLAEDLSSGSESDEDDEFFEDEETTQSRIGSGPADRIQNSAGQDRTGVFKPSTDEGKRSDVGRERTGTERREDA